jgi:hypothetical protein
MSASNFSFIENKIKEKAATDKNFRKKLIADPKKAIKDEFKISVPDDVKIKVVEDTGDTFHFVLPAETGSGEVKTW